MVTGNNNSGMHNNEQRLTSLAHKDLRGMMLPTIRDIRILPNTTKMVGRTPAPSRNANTGFTRPQTADNPPATSDGHDSHLPATSR